MLGLLFIYFIWKYFAELAEKNNRHKWGWGIGGVAFYYACTFLTGIVCGFIYVYQGKEITENDELMISLIGIPVGLTFTFVLYIILNSSWRKSNTFSGGEILD